MNYLTKFIALFLVVILALAVEFTVSAPVLNDADVSAELAALGFQQEQPHVYAAPQKKWSRLEPSIRFFKRSGAGAGNAPAAPLDLGSEWVLLGAV